MGHLDIPHGIDANEVHLGLHVGFHTGKDYPTALAAALASATREGGQYLGLAPLGQIAVGAPADLIVISTNVMANFKELEFPRYVLKDGAIVVERSTGQ
jgi:imidazolonepropionase-like amidohydrolase